jgi:hypothetical protein
VAKKRERCERAKTLLLEFLNSGLSITTDELQIRLINTAIVLIVSNLDPELRGILISDLRIHDHNIGKGIVFLLLSVSH